MREIKQEQTFALVLFVLLWKNISGNSSSPRIILPQGYVTGISIFTDSSTRINAYLGIPYALPPVGDLRFAPPERHPGWNRTLFAGHFRPDCPQLRQEGHDESEIINEDCLYLNIFVPEYAMTYRNYPVVVFIHGVDYVTGSPLIVNAEDLAKEGVIVITFSYRLNVFGFLTFEDEYARGNLGLLDQYMAFMWVKENIQYFGGLSNNITLMGHGSGSSSVLVHMSSPRTKNLFQKVILMSGSIFSPWLKSYSRTESHPAMTSSKIIARSIGCYRDNDERHRKSKNVLACMRQKSMEELLKAFESAYQNGNWTKSLGPISDDFLSPGDQYLPLDPTEAIRLGRYHKLPVMTGITCNEGIVTLHNWRDLIGQNDNNILHFMQSTAINNVLEKYELNSPETRNVVVWNYLKKIPKDSELIHQVLQLYNDAMFLAPFWHQVQTLAKNNDGLPIFAYFFTHPSFDYLGNYGRVLNLTGSTHGSELLYLFGPSLFQKVAGRRFTTSEERLSIKMKRLWTYFIRIGNPTPPSYGYNVWDKYDNVQESYLKMFIDRETGSNLEKMNGNPNREAFTFWTSLLPNLHGATKERMKKLEELLVLAGVPNSGSDLSISNCGSYKNAMFTTLAFLILLLLMLVLSLIFLKKRTKERDRCVL